MRRRLFAPVYLLMSLSHPKLTKITVDLVSFDIKPTALLAFPEEIIKLSQLETFGSFQTLHFSRTTISTVMTSHAG